jgi:hypothetical protein
MKRTRFYTAMLLAVMMLNSVKYQLPYIQYDLFRNYIAENLCVKRSETNNCCQGKCFLEKQINMVNEVDENPVNPVEKKQVNPETDDYIKSDNILPTSVYFAEVALLCFTANRLRKLSLDVILPPPKELKTKN